MFPDKNSHSWNAIISGYSKTGQFDHAYQLLDKMPEPYIVGYNSVISGLVHHGFYKESVFFHDYAQNG